MIIAISVNNGIYSLLWIPATCLYYLEAINLVYVNLPVGSGLTDTQSVVCWGRIKISHKTGRLSSSEWIINHHIHNLIRVNNHSTPPQSHNHTLSRPGSNHTLLTHRLLLVTPPGNAYGCGSSHASVVYTHPSVIVRVNFWELLVRGHGWMDGDGCRKSDSAG